MLCVNRSIPQVLEGIKLDLSLFLRTHFRFFSSMNNFDHIYSLLYIIFSHVRYQNGHNLHHFKPAPYKNDILQKNILLKFIPTLNMEKKHFPILFKCKYKTKFKNNNRGFRVNNSIEKYKVF